MNLKDLKNSAVRCIQNAVRVCAVAFVYGSSDTMKKQVELSYRLQTIRERLQVAIIKESEAYYDTMALLRNITLREHYNKFEDIITQIDFLNKDFMALNDRPNRRQKKWRQRFRNDLNTIWDVMADHQWRLQLEMDLARRKIMEDFKNYDNGYDGSLSSFSSASSFASNWSIWGGSSMSGSSCYEESLSGSSVSGSSISLTSNITMEENHLLNFPESKYKSKIDKDTIGDECEGIDDGKYESDLLEFMNGFQFDC